MAKYITREFKFKKATLSGPAGVKPVVVTAGDNLPALTEYFASVNGIKREQVKVDITDCVEKRRISYDKFMENSEIVPEPVHRSTKKEAK